jgi:peptidoglycan L-alanyl-D-glutamate endopeptidase CwlK
MRVTAVSFVWLKYVTCVSAKIVVAKTKKENKMAFKLSKRSLARLDGVNDKMVKVVTTAIGLSKIDFGVICGLRTIEEQRELVAKGASKTMKSKHIEGNAVDLMAYIGSRASWELDLYDDIADAMKIAADEHDVQIRWGAAWHIPDLREWDSSMQDAMNEYIDLRRGQGRRPFIDGPHFELM